VKGVDLIATGNSNCQDNSRPGILLNLQHPPG